MIGFLILLLFLLPQNKKGKYHRVTMWYAAISGILITFWWLGGNVDGIGAILSLAVCVWVYWYAYTLKKRFMTNA